MKLIKPTFEILEQKSSTLEGIYEQIERCARTCYKSENLIKGGSAQPFVERLIKLGHLAALEHGTVYLTITEANFNLDKESLEELIERYSNNEYSKLKIENEIIYITTNFRVIIENEWISDLRFISEVSEYHEKRVSILFTSDIHFYKDLTRHRKMSFCIESTRYCSYIGKKFGSELKMSLPCWLKEEDRTEFETDCEIFEQIYMKWLSRGWKTEEAAYFLGQGTSADITVTGFVSDWEHIFELRADTHAHISIQELMYPLLEEFKRRNYIK